MLGSDLPTLVTVITTALIDSINPCAIGVMILMISSVLVAGQSLRRLLFLGLVYIFAIFSAYLLAGLGLLYFLADIPLFVTEYLSMAVGGAIVIAGLLEIKDYFWYGRGFSLAIPKYFSEKLNGFASRTSTFGVFFLGLFVAVVELPCTGAPYLAIITLLSESFDMSAFMLLVIYNLVFVAPLLIILILVLSGVKLQSLKLWRENNRGSMRLMIGLFLIVLGWLLIFIANGIINFG